MISRVADVWDDLIDQDKPVSEERINEAFYLAMVQIPANAFYQRHGPTLRPVLATGILNWMAATSIERSKDRTLEQLQISHVIRYSIADIMLLIAHLIGGREWGFKWAAQLRLLGQKNSFGDYLKEHE